MNEASPPFSVPRLRTERLLLREFRLEDFEGFAGQLADPEATRFSLSAPDRRNAWRIFGSGLGGWALTGGGWWSIEVVATGEVVGSVGAFYREDWLDRLDAADLELGWMIQRAHWRKGYASEAAAAALAFGLGKPNVRRIIALIDPENHASIAVSRKIGMRFEGEADFYGKPTGRYVRTRP